MRIVKEYKTLCLFCLLGLNFTASNLYRFRDNMDQNKLLEIASYVTNLKLFPYFDAAHYAVMCLMVRDDNGAAEHSGNFSTLERVVLKSADNADTANYGHA